MYVVLSLGTRDEIRVSACRRVQSEPEKVNCIWQFLTNMTPPPLSAHAVRGAPGRKPKSGAVKSPRLVLKGERVF